jgi:hypothetical protein
MTGSPQLGRLLVVAGLLLLVGGVLILTTGRLPLLGSLGRLPGDLVFRRGGLTVYLPITTSIVVSLLLTLVLAFAARR